jgi:large subunit ribosomal protein L29
MPTAHDLSMLTEDELGARLGDSRRELFNLRFQLATGQLDNSARIGQVKRDVARMLTVLREREILEAEGAYVAPTQAEHEAAQAKLAAEDAALAEKADARRAAAEAETTGDEGAELPDEMAEFDQGELDEGEFDEGEFDEGDFAEGEFDEDEDEHEDEEEEEEEEV